MEQHRAPITVNDTLAWMSDLIIGPILTSLPRPPSAAAPIQISWCPTGLLSFLPLHAAAADLVVSSYTPTLGALLAAQARPRRTPPAPFIIDVSALPDALLTVAAKEVAVLEPMFPGARVGALLRCGIGGRAESAPGGVRSLGQVR
jgi:hypothetical protein